jgi:hypothetical protein
VEGRGAGERAECWWKGGVLVEGRSAGGRAECWWRGLVSAADFLTRGKVKPCNKLPYQRLGEVGGGVRRRWCLWAVVFVVGWWLVVVRSWMVVGGRSWSVALVAKTPSSLIALW